MEREKKALELALFSKKVAANQAEIDYIRQEKGKLLDDRQALIAQVEEHKTLKSGHRERVEDLRASVR